MSTEPICFTIVDKAGKTRAHVWLPVCPRKGEDIHLGVVGTCNVLQVEHRPATLTTIIFVGDPYPSTASEHADRTPGAPT